jgi:hypothetical protein
MLVQDVQVQLIGPPISIRRSARFVTGSAAVHYRTFSCAGRDCTVHAFNSSSLHKVAKYKCPTVFIKRFPTESNDEIQVSFNLHSCMRGMRKRNMEIDSVDL